MMLIVLVHHSCAAVFAPRFTASLNMQLFFAVFATQVRSVFYLFCIPVGLNILTSNHSIKTMTNPQKQI